MANSVSRRQFIHGTTAATAAAAVVGPLSSTADAAGQGGAASAWDKAPDRIWLGAEFWANPLQDWRLAEGRIECLNAAVNRNVHWLTHSLGDQLGDVKMSVRLGRVGGGAIDDGPGSAGFRIGINGPLREYRNNAIFGQGLDAGITTAGKLFIGAAASGVPIELSADSIELQLLVEPAGEQSAITLSAHNAAGQELARVGRRVATASLAGNVALVANFTGGNANPGKAGKLKGKKKAAGPAAGLGQFWFADWRLRGSRVEEHPNRAYGPILFNHYTLSGGVLTMTAQMPPLGNQDSPIVRLQVQRDGDWHKLAEAPIHAEARTATFRISDWDATRDVPYRLVYSLAARDGQSSEHFWPGTIRHDPIEQPMLTVADISCNIHEAFPNVLYTANMAKLNPDFLAFVGDQFYENAGGYGVQRTPLEPSILDYLRKWYMHGWTWRELTRDRPSISIPDDHDVYQGNLWGVSGSPQTTTQEAGGYNMPAAWVNVVHRTQTSHHPAPWDATPCKQGISVYSGSLVYGRVSFAILADRQFKSAPEGNVPPTGGRGDHVTDPNFDPQTADVAGLQLLGPGQMKFLQAWVADWRGAEMKAVISQTTFTSMATTHGSPNGRLIADYDTNGWPQTERNAALRLIRQAFAVHIAGDQHLPAVVHYGIDMHRDAGIAFAGPPVNTGYPRWFEPAEPGQNRAAGAAENTGDFRDCFGNPMTVLALANGSKMPRTTVLEKMHDKVSGIGIVRFDKPNRRITLECWPFLADPTEPGTQFPGWPQAFDMLANYGRKGAAYLPKLQVQGIESPVVEVIEEKTGERVYSLRLAGSTFQPHVFAPGKYTLRISEPETGKAKELTGVEALEKNALVLKITA